MVHLPMDQKLETEGATVEVDPNHDEEAMDSKESLDRPLIVISAISTGIVVLLNTVLLVGVNTSNLTWEVLADGTYDPSGFGRHHPISYATEYILLLCRGVGTIHDPGSHQGYQDKLALLFAGEAKPGEGVCGGIRAAQDYNPDAGLHRVPGRCHSTHDHQFKGRHFAL